MNELYHYGIKGQKWGVRRYRNEDGSLTPAGKKRYSSMSDDKLQKTLYKQVKKTRAEQSGWSNQWAVSNTIGKYSKAQQDRFSKDRREYENSEAYKEANKKIKKLDRLYDSGKIDPDKYDVEYEKVRESIYKPEFDRSVVFTNNGRKYAQEYIDTYGRDLNIAYLKDLGYNEQTAVEFADRVIKSKRKVLDGM